MYKLKQIEEDFRVTEIADLKFEPGPYNYYLLIKKGFRTDECILYLAKHLNISASLITYFGLKDENGITNQFISIENIKKAIEYKFKKDNKFFEIHFIGTSNKSMKIGKLYGNAFHVKIRNLTDKDISILENNTKKTCFVLNYYDTQRFGLPNFPKIAHKIGKAILDKNYTIAFQYLYESGNINKECFENNKATEKEYINSIDQRKLNFFLSAYDSFIWNNKLKKQIQSIPNIYNRIKDNINFLFIKSDLCKSIQDELTITRHEISENKTIIERLSSRALILQVNYHLSKPEIDKSNINKYSIDISFYLPSGAYATSTIDQILFNLNILDLE